MINSPFDGYLECGCIDLQDEQFRCVIHSGKRMPEQKRGRSKQDWFWSCVDQSNGPDACWPWTKGKTTAGYGSIYLGGGRKNRVHIYAHRLALELNSNAVGDVALHICDNPSCCNPKHLHWGSKKDNSQDALQKGRAYIGSKNSNAKFTEFDIKTIKQRRANGNLYKDIAASYGVSEGTIRHIVHGRTWKHV